MWAGAGHNLRTAMWWMRKHNRKVRKIQRVRSVPSPYRTILACPHLTAPRRRKSTSSRALQPSETSAQPMCHDVHLCVSSTPSSAEVSFLEEREHSGILELGRNSSRTNHEDDCHVMTSLASLPESRYLYPQQSTVIQIQSTLVNCHLSGTHFSGQLTETGNIFYNSSYFFLIKLEKSTGI